MKEKLIKINDINNAWFKKFKKFLISVSTRYKKARKITQKLEIDNDCIMPEIKTTFSCQKQRKL